MLQPRVIDLNTTVTDSAKLLKRMIGEDIELVTATDPNLEMIKADPGQITQVILNLVINARDAMPHGGRLEATFLSLFSQRKRKAKEPDSVSRQLTG
jgi:signal transduction histidine kinase